VPSLDKDANLGVIQIPEPKPVGNVRLKTTGRLDSFPESRGGGVTFVAADGSGAYSFGARSNTEFLEIYPSGFPALPAGTYYIAPCMFLANKCQVTLIRRVAAGEDLSATLIPRVTIRPGEEATVTVDEPQAEQAILTDSKPKAPAPKNR
jgi:hypothetical protein